MIEEKESKLFKRVDDLLAKQLHQDDVWISRDDLAALRILAEENTPNELLEKIDQLITGYQMRIQSQIANQNRLLKRFIDLRHLMEGGGTDSTKVLRAKGMLP